jgi:hypothetical protein
MNHSLLRNLNLPPVSGNYIPIFHLHIAEYRYPAKLIYLDLTKLELVLVILLFLINKKHNHADSSGSTQSR